MVGAACFLWVIAGDLSAAFRDAAPLPGVLEAAGPALFQVGLLSLLVLLVVARRLLRRLRGLFTREDPPGPGAAR
jgi:hypothetical protein